MTGCAVRPAPQFRQELSRQATSASLPAGAGGAFARARARHGRIIGGISGVQRVGRLPLRRALDQAAGAWSTGGHLSILFTAHYFLPVHFSGRARLERETVLFRQVSTTGRLIWLTSSQLGVLHRSMTPDHPRLTAVHHPVPVLRRGWHQAGARCSAIATPMSMSVPSPTPFPHSGPSAFSLQAVESKLAPPGQ